MPIAEMTIRPIDDGSLDTFLSYLADHLKDNGRNGVPLFQPISRHAVWSPSDRRMGFAVALKNAVGAANWRRAWAAFDARDTIIGHVDLRAHGEPNTGHRALLGVGVHRNHRRRLLGRALVEHAVSWAVRDTDIDWIDLTVLGGNEAAERLYLRLGFERTAIVADMFRIDGESLDNVLMARRIHR